MKECIWGIVKENSVLAFPEFLKNARWLPKLVKENGQKGNTKDNRSILFLLYQLVWKLKTRNTESKWAF